jgi:hypothetical protein
LAFIPAAIARETPHALRSLQVLPTFQILAAIGILTVIDHHRQLKPVIVAVYIILAGIFFETYFIHYPRHWSASWQYGYKQLVSYLSTVKDQYDRIYVTQSLGRPHTYLLFYQQYDPLKYLQTRQAGGDAFGFTYVNSFDKYYFTDPDPNLKPPGEKWLIVSRPDGVQAGTPVLKTIYDPEQQPVFVVIQK